MEHLMLPQLRDRARRMGFTNISYLKKEELQEMLASVAKANEMGFGFPEGTDARKITEEVERIEELEFFGNDLFAEFEALGEQYQAPELREMEFPYLKVRLWPVDPEEDLYDIQDPPWYVGGDNLLLRYIFPEARYHNDAFVIYNDDYPRKMIEVLRRFDSSKRRLSPKRPLNDTVGTIGWDVDVTFPEDINLDKMPSVEYMPYLVPDGIRFPVCGVYQSVTDQMLMAIFRSFPNVHPYPVFMGHHSDDRIRRYFNSFAKSESTIALVTNSDSNDESHIQTLFKLGDQYLLIDSMGVPHPSLIPNVTKFEEITGTKITIVEREREQQAEDSCALHSIALAIMLSYYGSSALEKRVEPWTAVVAARIYQSVMEYVYTTARE